MTKEEQRQRFDRIVFVLFGICPKQEQKKLTEEEKGKNKKLTLAIQKLSKETNENVKVKKSGGDDK
ncbi:hypothetical protein KKC67_01635 [Patescibacteria group bacterium]|nr:hypothetical protein [Patescibacteria group bacterium]MBU0879502.1 hypothetical protein [Patescibacteria group bacterium]MBU0880335.1 hypothetical protein [Patescibacteria group bacterium]MBU0897518.1 hypothetical protein [Patescibacteria group bacterium]MBU1063168.1 hypothetical protein [Patescibacteria group bacterium]